MIKINKGKKDKKDKSTILDHARAHLDAVAQERGYKDMVELCSFSTSTITQRALDGLAGIEYRDVVLTQADATIDDTKGKNKKAPKRSDFTGNLPPIVWPEA
jgi:hypothetical protein